ncbi:uncharacterized protein MELLADRAFT_103468 [Melampsora larici-populina 98AG31]|uniref:Uncharacterized protein n=1 Tax=Melampsora larici-populina (strain 98AG31 / pathotype 3-4-7) TaxID=747676 RepID=F4RB44_MELLP|nr:uncharacterized protein MELLADRAFT_103468 [Melampsora larici-populina 98AG31]EGG10348.1 hypothetical protein MELLADRAFT_103468 [Melampsora larici-populina 98AG31]
MSLGLDRPEPPQFKRLRDEAQCPFQENRRILFCLSRAACLQLAQLSIRVGLFSHLAEWLSSRTRINLLQKDFKRVANAPYDVQLTIQHLLLPLKHFDIPLYNHLEKYIQFEMSAEDLKEAIDAKFKQLEAAIKLDTGDELQLVEEPLNGAGVLGNEASVKYSSRYVQAEFESEDPGIAAKYQPSKAFVVINIRILAALSILVVIISTWAFKSFSKLDGRVVSGYQSTHQSWTMDIPVF